MVTELVNTFQAKFSVLATTTPHYSRYFTHKHTDTGESEVVSDVDRLREACSSFLDSIVLELCFPREMYPKHILFSLLRDTIKESPGEAKRFPQALWDSVGDLSVSVELLEILELPLLGPEGYAWKNFPRGKSVEYEQWINAQVYSEKVSDNYRNLESFVDPLEKTQDQATLDDLWKLVNLNYKAVSGVGIDSLWHLKNAFRRTPRWHSPSSPTLAPYKCPKLRTKSKFEANSGKVSLRTIRTEAKDEDDDDGPPPLQSVSDISEDDYTSDSDDDSHDRFSDSESEDDASIHDIEEQIIFRNLERQAMDTAHANGYLVFDADVPPDLDTELEDRNPFLKLLGSLRGRGFSSNPKLKSIKRTVSTGPGADSFSVSESSTNVHATQQPQSRKATIEEVEDEDEVVQPIKKKKKNLKKKRCTLAPSPVKPKEGPSSPPVVPCVPSSEASHPPPASPASPAKEPAEPIASSPSPGTSLKSANLLQSLGVDRTTAQSARSYLQSENLDCTKHDNDPGPEVAENSEPETEINYFARLGKLTKYMHQLLGTSQDEKKGGAGMKWKVLVKLMLRMGYNFDPSTAGSSVRFDPPNPLHKSISIHKPHPDTTIGPVMLKQIGTRLKIYYGWSEKDLAGLV